MRRIEHLNSKSKQRRIMEMNRTNLCYYFKNISVPSKKTYVKCMRTKLEHFIKRLRWKAFFFDRKGEKLPENRKNTFGYKTVRTPPQHELLNPFEEDFCKMVKSIKFRQICNAFQTCMAEEVNKINQSYKILVLADKKYKLVRNGTR